MGLLVFDCNSKTGNPKKIFKITNPELIHLSIYEEFDHILFLGERQLTPEYSQWNILPID